MSNFRVSDECRANGCKWRDEECEECGAEYRVCDACGTRDFPDGGSCEECDEDAATYMEENGGPAETPAERAARTDAENLPAALANLSRLPERAYMVNDGTRGYFHTALPVVHFRRGESGFYVDAVHGMDPAEYVRAQNAHFNATAAHAAAMHAGSVFGWSVPAADARIYYADGQMMDTDAADAARRE
jgi:hypothetical protein